MVDARDEDGGDWIGVGGHEARCKVSAETVANGVGLLTPRAGSDKLSETGGAAIP